MKQKTFRLLADLRFAIFILLIISFCSILGTIIEQDQPIEIYKRNYPLLNPVGGWVSWDRILWLGLDHIYQTWWFLTLIFLFGLSLTLCSLLQQFPLLKIARRCQFFRMTEQFYKLKFSTILASASLNKTLSYIKKTNYSIFQQKNVIYSYKGLIGRLAPIVVHFSMILVLMGTIVGSLFGFKAQEIAPTTENFHIQNIINNGPLTRLSQITTRVNSFWITYTKQRTVFQFYSDLSILKKNGNELYQQTICVNAPLIDNNIYYYQTDWNIVGLRFKNLNDGIVEYPVNFFLNQGSKLWGTWVSNNTLNSISNSGLLLILDNLEGYCSLYNEQNQFLGNLELHEPISLKKSVILLQIICATGLQVKNDPGLAIIYGGFFLLMISALTSYITYSQIWIVQKNKKLFIGGTTNRDVFEFELEFFKLIKMN